MLELSDLFKGSFSFMNQTPSLEHKLNNQNLPLEDFLKDDEVMSAIKYMGKNTTKYLNSEKIKKLIKLITEEPKEDDQLRGHKLPFVACEILKLDCPFITKRFVLNEQEYHEEYPDSSEEEIGDFDFYSEEKNDNENKEIDFDFKKKKIEFEKIYAQIKENFRNLNKSINMDKQERKSKDDLYKDEYKMENKDYNNYEEECEEYEENKEDNVIDGIEKDENDNEIIENKGEINKNPQEKEEKENIIENNNEVISGHNIKKNLNEKINNEININNENENNIENHSNDDDINEKNMKENEKHEKNNIEEISDIKEDDIDKQINSDNNELKINEEKNNEINELNNDVKGNKEEKNEINEKNEIIEEKIEKSQAQEKNNEKENKEEEIKDIIKDKVEEKNLENINTNEKKMNEKQKIIGENTEDNKKEINNSKLKKNEETKEEIKKETKEEIKEEIKEDVKKETKEEIKEENKEVIKEEIKEENIEETNEEIKTETKNKAKEEIKEENKDVIKEENKNETKEEKKEDIKKETKETIKEENKNEIKEEIQEEIKEKTKEIIKEETQRKIKYENNEENKENIKEENKEEIKEQNKDEIKEENKEEIKIENKGEIKEENKEEIKDENKEEFSQYLKKEKNDTKIDSNNINNNNNEEIKIENKRNEEVKEIQIKEQEKKIDISPEKINSELKQEGNENNDLEKLENEIIEENLKNDENKIIDEKNTIQEQNIIENVVVNKEEEQEKKLENDSKEKDIEINQEEELNEEINNIIIDKVDEEKDNNKNNNDENNNKDIENKEDNQAFNMDNDNEDLLSISVEGELDDEEQNKKSKKKKVYKNSQNNEYFDLLLNFVMTDKPELNYVLSGYFANVIISLLGTYPYKILKYLYTQRRDALKKIIFHSNQKAFAILSSKLLSIESYMKFSKNTKNEINDFIMENIPYRNELIKEIITSINLDGLIPYSNQNNQIDIEGIFSLISGLIDENSLIAKELIYNNHLCPHLFDILETNLYADIEKNDNFKENNFNRRYTIYGLFIDLTSKFLKIINTNYSSFIPMDFDFQALGKPKTDLQFNDNMIITFGKIIKYNFLAKKPPLILETMSSVKYEGLGSLNLRIFELVKNMFFFMKALPNQFDLLLIRNKFCQRSIEYFFKYQWNNFYQNKFVNFFCLYLEEEERHPELTKFYFDNIKLQDLLLNFLQEIYPENNDIIVGKKKYEFKSGNKIKSGIYSHIIDLIYKIQAYSGLEIFSESEKSQFGIKNLGEFEFSKDEKSNKIFKKLNISNNLKNIFSKDEKWNSIFKNQVLPILRKYEGQLCKKLKVLDDDDSDIKNEYGSNSLLLQQMLNVLKKATPPKRFSIPISRNDKNSNTSILNKGSNEKISIRSKLLSKGYRSRHIFDDDDDDEKKEKDNNNIDKENKEEEINENNPENEKDKMFYDSNYWELKNDLPENIKKEVDKKTNIIFNYNPITGENEKKSEISEEDELLSIAMGLEQNEKIEKNKKVMYIMPGRIKPINLKTKSNPVQNIFINITNPKKNNKYENIRNKKKDIINFFDTENNNENEEQEQDVENADQKIDNKIDDDEENNAEEIIHYDDNNDKVNKKELDNDEMFNDVNYWKSNNNYLNEEEMKDLINDL